MDYMISCPCGHTLEVHESALGCARCECTRDRQTCLDAAIEIARAERAYHVSSHAGRDDEAFPDAARAD
jgi:hypothetical protein